MLSKYEMKISSLPSSYFKGFLYSQTPNLSLANS
jgi:hypothetical protein